MALPTHLAALLFVTGCTHYVCPFHPLYQSLHTVRTEDAFDVVKMEAPNAMSRVHFLTTTVVAAAQLIQQPVNAFDGGVGGLGKTKPDTGVVLWEGSAALQNPQGIVSAELNIDGSPVLVEFTTPWPLLATTGGLEARDLQSSESAFVQVTPSFSSDKEFQKIVLDTILGPQGKYGAYSAPVDVKLKKVGDELYLATFIAYTPAMRESERSLLLKVAHFQKSAIVLVTGATRVKFKSQQSTFERVANSFVAIKAPESQRNTGQ